MAAPWKGARRRASRYLENLLELPHNHRRIVPAKSKTIAHRKVETPLAGRIGRVVEVASRIGIGQVDRRRNHALSDGFHRHDQLDAAARTERMPELAFGAANAELPGVLAIHALDRLRFRGVAQRRARAV